MNILFICDEYPPGLNGGIGTVTRSLARAFAEQGHKVYVVGLYTYAYGEKDYEEDGSVKVWRMRYGWRLPAYPILYKIQRKLPAVLRTALYGKRQFRRFTGFVERLVEQEKMDIVEQPDWNTSAYDIGLREPVLPALNVPLVVKSHGSYTYFCSELGIQPKASWQHIDKALYRRADALAAVSIHTAAKNKQLFALQKPVKVLYNAMTIPGVLPDAPRQKHLVFFSGSLVKKKGIFELMKAWNSVLQQFPAAELVVFGKGETEPLRQLLPENAIGTVRFMGHQPKEVLLEYLRQATLAVFPSFSETFGLVAVEAMSTGCPTIFTQLSCGPEIIRDEQDGLLVNPNNIDEISAAIIRLLQDPGLRERLGHAGYLAAKARFDMKQSIQDHHDFYTETIRAYRAPRT